MTGAAVTIFLVDDDASVLRAMTRLLKGEGFNVESHASPRAFLDRAEHDGPGCVVLDLRMPGLDGLAVQKALAEKGRLLPIVFVSGQGNVPASVEAMKAGAIDFLTKPFDDERLLAAVRSGIARSVIAREHLAGLRALELRVGRLTPREREVLPLVVQGLPNKVIASRLGTSLKTIKVHRARVMEKMEADSLPELVRMAGRLGISA
jgi:FixJ family two-component response regulator